jgi:hypothetical protein
MFDKGVSFAIHVFANIRYGCKHALKIVVRNTSVAFTCKQLASLNKCS